eukprot:scaffold5218_cov150-Ochromonas_danica.AAC.7
MAIEGEAERLEKQLFVRNLSYDVKEEDLTALFEEFGPLKNVSVAYDKNHQSKGFAFVKFALEDDAKAALAKLDGRDLKGRPIKLELGLKKERKASAKPTATSSSPLAEVKPAGEAQEEREVKTALERVSKKKEEAKKKKEEEEEVVEKKEEAKEKEGGEEEEEHVKSGRQVLIFGLPIDLSKKAFKYAISKISRKVDVELIKEDHPLSQSLGMVHPAGKVFLATAPSRQEAQKLLAGLSNATVHNLNLVKYLKEEGDSNTLGEEEEQEGLRALTTAVLATQSKHKIIGRSLASLSPPPLRKKKCRIIIRNLSFQATEQNIIDKVGRFGPLAEVDLPRVTIDKAPRKRKRGGEEQEDKAQVERPRGFAFVTFLCHADAERAVKESADLRICNRPVALDFSLSKDSFSKYGSQALPEDKENEEEEDDEHAEVAKEENDAEMTAKEQEDEEMDAEEDEVEDEEEDVEEEGEEEIGEEDEMDEEDVEEEVEDEEDDEPKQEVKKQRFGDDVHEGRTVFLRDLSFDTKPADLRTALSSFGKIDLAILVTDKATGMSKGSAFVKFRRPEEAAACISAARDGLTIQNRSCKVALAMDKQSVDQLKSKALKAKDKRNIYLANEGLVVTAGTETVNIYDREKRERAQSEKKKKLLNPLFFVSATRLSIRNLAKQLQDKDLRALCIEAARKGIEKGLVTAQDMKNQLIARGEAVAAVVADFKAKSSAMNKKESKELAIPPVRPSAVKTAKIMLDLARLQDGRPQSRGYGFVEFRHHAHALACLRELNNNSAYEEKAVDADGKGLESVKSRLMVEFSLENMRKVKILQERQEKSRQRASAKNDGAVTQPAAEAPTAVATKVTKAAANNATAKRKRPSTDEPKRDWRKKPRK